MHRESIRALVSENDQDQPWALRELTAAATHRLTELLAVVLGRTELLLRSEESSPIRRHLRVAKESAMNAAEVVRWVHRFSQMKLSERTEADLNRVVAEALDVMRVRCQSAGQAEARSIEVAREAGIIGPVLGNAVALREAVTNLVLNAVEAVPEGGRISVRTLQSDGWVGVTVADTGIGMSEEVKRRALEPFFTTKGVRNAGLGLSVSYRIVKEHGGTLDIETAEGLGTTVTIRLPACPAARDEGVGLEAALGTAAVSPLRILVIDDDEVVREVLVEMLAVEGHQVLQAAGGGEGLAVLEAGEPVDLVMTDLSMPEMTGWGVARAIRARWPGLPVVFLTGLESLDVALADGQSMILSKPVTAESLREVIAAARGGPS